MPNYSLSLTFSAEVRAALEAGEAVVALESTLITHGLPFPINIETALAMEEAVRAAGAVPATIAILAGQVTVGLTEGQIRELAAAPAVRKCSRRDLPIVIARSGYGATTVAATMIVAHQAGIRVFATGGIGGVHRGQPFDISADLLELGRTPVAVVCSGAKSILDLPLTLEVLETQGVPVIGFGVDRLPAFYTRETDLPIDARVENASEAAAIIAASVAINAPHGLLIAVPVPAEVAIPADDAEAAIAQATEEAHQNGLTGARVTPFVLGRVAEITEGRSRSANTALLVNNAYTAGQIARALRPLLAQESGADARSD